jgi:hypothetical protein
MLNGALFQDVLAPIAARDVADLVAGANVLPPGFAFSILPDGAYETWPDGSLVVEYVG